MKLTPKNQRALETIAASKDAWPDVAARARMLLAYQAGSVSRWFVDAAVLGRIEANTDPYIALRGVHPAWCPQPAITLTDSERETLEMIAAETRPRNERGDVLYAQRILDLATRPMKNGDNRDRKALRVVGAVGAVAACDAATRVDVLAPSRKLTQGWRPSQADREALSALDTGTLTKSQQKRYDILAFMCANPELGFTGVAKALGVPKNTINHTIWLGGRKGAVATVFSSNKP